MPSHTFLPPTRSQQPQQTSTVQPQGSNNQFYHPHPHPNHHHHPNVLTSTANNSFVPVAPPIQMSHENSAWSRQQHLHLQPAHNNNLRPTGNSNSNSTTVGSHFGIYNGKQFVPSDGNYPMMGPSSNALLLEQQRRELEEQQHRAALNAAATAKKEKEERDEKHRRHLEKVNFWSF